MRAALALAALFGSGALLGILSGFLSLEAPRVLGVPIPVGVLLAGAGNVALGMTASAAVGGRRGAVAAACGWGAVVAMLSQRRPEGDLVVTGDALGVAFLAIGLLSWAVAIARNPIRRGPTMMPASAVRGKEEQ